MQFFELRVVCRRHTVARVLGVDTLDIGVGGEEVHEDSLDRLALVNDGFCPDVEPANGVGVDVVFFEETMYDWRGTRRGCQRSQ